MKRNKNLFRIRFVFILFILSSTLLQAQEGLHIQTIFEKYGKSKGSTMVVLSGKALYNYRLDKYQGITLKYNKNSLSEIQQSLEVDKKDAVQIKEIITGGIITAGYYQLNDENHPINRYILFKMGDDGTATLIYMEGGSESEELVNKLFIKQR